MIGPVLKSWHYYLVDSMDNLPEEVYRADVYYVYSEDIKPEFMAFFRYYKHEMYIPIEPFKLVYTVR